MHHNFVITFLMLFFSFCTLSKNIVTEYKFLYGPSLSENQAFELENGNFIVIKSKKESLLEISGNNLMQLIWHIGNRHIPCEIKQNKIFIQNDAIIKDMIKKLGGKVRAVKQTFAPEGGAYGLGRTHSHKH